MYLDMTIGNTTIASVAVIGFTRHDQYLDPGPVDLYLSDGSSVQISPDWREFVETLNAFGLIHDEKMEELLDD